MELLANFLDLERRFELLTRDVSFLFFLRRLVSPRQNFRRRSSSGLCGISVYHREAATLPELIGGHLEMPDLLLPFPATLPFQPV